MPTGNADVLLYIGKAWNKLFKIGNKMEGDPASGYALHSFIISIRKVAQGAKA